MEANSAAEIEAIGAELLKQGPYLLKDPFGVSGKGNLLIDSEAMRRRIAEHLHKQEGSGLRVQFLLEPLSPKVTDFSSHWFIQENGKTEFISVQRMMNHQQNYSGSIKADEAFIGMLENVGYFTVMEKALRVLVEDDYHGFVCFDSMVLEDGEVVSIVEINARKSMGLINAYLDKWSEPYGLTGWLTFSLSVFREASHSGNSCRLYANPVFVDNTRGLRDRTAIIQYRHGERDSEPAPYRRRSTEQARRTERADVCIGGGL